MDKRIGAYIMKTLYRKVILVLGVLVVSSLGMRFRFRSRCHNCTAYIDSFANRHSHTNKNANTCTHIYPHTRAYVVPR
jgi:hypothetical protein